MIRFALRLLVVPVEDLVRNATVRPPVHKGQGVRPVPGNADDRDQCVGQDAANGGIGLEFLEFHAAARPFFFFFGMGEAPISKEDLVERK